MWPLTSACQARFLVCLRLDRGRGIVESIAYLIIGILTLLVIVAAIFLMYGLTFHVLYFLASDSFYSRSRKGLGYRPVKILLPSTLMLYGSTALYMASLASHVASVDRLVSHAQAGLFSGAYIEADVSAFEADVLKQSWMMTIALGINVRQVSHSKVPVAL